MKQVDMAEQLGNMIDRQSMYSGNISVDDNIPVELEEQPLLFEYNFEDELHKMTNNAAETVSVIVKSVVPEMYQTNDILRNKMLLDANQLGMLYYQQDTINVLLQTAMKTIASGDTSPKMFDSATKLQKEMANISAQITELQNEFRKYYIDTYLDLESKDRVDEVGGYNTQRQIATNGIPVAKKEVNMIEQEQNIPGAVQTENGVRFSDNKTDIKSLYDIKLAKFMAEAEEAEFSESK